MEKKKFFTVQRITLIGVLSAMVFALTKFASIPIPSPLGKTAIQLGNTMCILSALLFGPITGSLAAGIGSAMVDLTDPAWAPEFWITFINKFAMAMVAGLLMHVVRFGRERIRIWLAGAAGAMTYVVLYLTKNIISGHFVKGFTWDVALTYTLGVKLPISLANGIIATICAALLYLAMSPALRRAHLLGTAA